MVMALLSVTKCPLIFFPYSLTVKNGISELVNALLYQKSLVQRTILYIAVHHMTYSILQKKKGKKCNFLCNQKICICFLNLHDPGKTITNNFLDLVSFLGASFRNQQLYSNTTTRTTIMDLGGFRVSARGGGKIFYVVTKNSGNLDTFISCTTTRIPLIVYRDRQITLLLNDPRNYINITLN